MSTIVAVMPEEPDNTDRDRVESLKRRQSALTDSDFAAVSGMKTPALRDELGRALELTARHLMYLAAVWSELEKRGEDLSALRSGLTVYLPLIAVGSIVPEIVVRFAGNQTLLRAVSMLTPDQQREIANGKPMLVVERSGDKFTHRMLPAHSLSWVQAKQVFAERSVRNEPEQIAYLKAATPPAPPSKTPKHGKLRANREKGVLELGRHHIKPADALAALADLNGKSDRSPNSEDPSVSARLTPEEMSMLKQRAAAGSTTAAALIRNALRASGMI